MRFFVLKLSLLKLWQLSFAIFPSFSNELNMIVMQISSNDIWYPNLYTLVQMKRKVPVTLNQSMFNDRKSDYISLDSYNSGWKSRILKYWELIYERQTHRTRALAELVTRSKIARVPKTFIEWGSSSMLFSIIGSNHSANALQKKKQIYRIYQFSFPLILLYQNNTFIFWSPYPPYIRIYV